MSRRFVVGVVAAVLAVLVLGGIIVWAAGGDGSRRSAVLEESTSEERFGLNWYLFGGTTTGQAFWADVESVAGCDMTGDVATVSTGPAADGLEKTISGFVPSACRIKFVVNARAAPALYNWLNDSLSETYSRKNLTLVKKLGTGSQRMSISLEDTLIERIELPALQVSTYGGTTNPGTAVTIGLTVRPEESTLDSSGGPLPPSARPVPADTTRFDVALTGGASLSSMRPSRFEPWSAGVKITRGSPGQTQIHLNEASDLSVGDLGLSISTETSQGADAANELHDWFDDFVASGLAGPGPNAERTLTLTVKDPVSNTAPPFLTVTFTNVGILGQPSYWLGNNPQKFLLYAEAASFAGLPVAAPPPPPPPAAPPPAAPPPPAPPPPAAPPPPPPVAAAPPAPANLAAVVEGSVVNLSWEPVKAPSYRVFYGSDPGGPYKLLRETSEPTLTAELPPGTYYFVVRAVNGEAESENSNEVSGELAG